MKIGDKKIEDLVNNGHFNHLNVLLVSKAPHLTIRAASTLIHKCPKLADLQDLGKWMLEDGIKALKPSKVPHRGRYI